MDAQCKDGVRADGVASFGLGVVASRWLGVGKAKAQGREMG